MTYRPDPVLVGLHRRKMAYQRTFITAWFVVIAAVSPAFLWSGLPDQSDALPESPASISSVHSLPSGGGGLPDLGATVGCPPEPLAPGFSGFGGNRFRVIRDAAYRADIEIAQPALDGFDLTFAVDRSYGRDGSQTLSDLPDEGWGAGSDPTAIDFGLPDEPLWAEAIGRSHFPGWGPKSIIPGYGDPAIIEWFQPQYPRPAFPRQALVRAILTLSGVSDYRVRLLGVDVWGFKEGVMIESYSTDVDTLGFASAVVQALHNCIFWPGQDFRGNPITGDYLIVYHFCPECPIVHDTVISRRGQVLIRQRRR